MRVHVLPGDAYVDTFRETGIDGEVVVFRECLVEGDLWGPSLPEFWKTRENYLSSTYPEPDNDYQDSVAGEIERILKHDAGDEICLWFEYELFCSVNYWFCLNLLRDTRARVFRVSPTVRDEQSKWNGFGKMTADEMRVCWDARVALTVEDIEQGTELWHAFKTGNEIRIRKLGEYESSAFPHLREVTEAAAEKETRPKEIVRDIVRSGTHDFGKVFAQFAERAGVYGLGDAQVKRIFEQL
jgi:hypothetical protein